MFFYSVPFILEQIIILFSFSELPIAIELQEDSFSDSDLKPWLGCSVIIGKPEVKQKKGKKQSKENSTNVIKKKVPSLRARGNFPCDKCGRTYIRRDSLQRHLQWECGKEPQFQCPFCPQKCKRKTHQTRHIRRQHRDMIGMLNENNPDFKFDISAFE